MVSDWECSYNQLCVSNHISGTSEKLRAVIACRRSGTPIASPRLYNVMFAQPIVSVYNLRTSLLQVQWLIRACKSLTRSTEGEWENKRDLPQFYKSQHHYCEGLHCWIYLLSCFINGSNLIPKSLRPESCATPHTCKTGWDLWGIGAISGLSLFMGSGLL